MALLKTLRAKLRRFWFVIEAKCLTTMVGWIEGSMDNNDGMYRRLDGVGMVW